LVRTALVHLRDRRPIRWHHLAFRDP